MILPRQGRNNIFPDPDIFNPEPLPDIHHLRYIYIVEREIQRERQRKRERQRQRQRQRQTDTE